MNTADKAPPETASAAANSAADLAHSKAAKPSQSVSQGDSRLTGPSAAIAPLLVLFSVIIPCLALWIEAASGMSADAYVDPIPTPIHFALVVYVIVSVVVLMVWRKPLPPKQRYLLGMMTGAALLFSGAYTILYLPIMPVAIFAVLFLGMGLLPMAPLFSFIGLIVGYISLKDRFAEATGDPRVGGLLRGALAGLGIFFVMTSYDLAGTFATQMALSEEPALQRRGAQMVRSLGFQHTLLDLSEVQQRGALIPTTFAARPFVPAVSQDRARRAYYLATGTTYLDASGGSGDLAPWWAGADQGLGGTAVGPVQRNLTSSNSHQHVTIDPIAATGTVAWTMNLNGQWQEGRMNMVLPPGGVVSRVTLWVNGEEREGAYAERDRVTRAYRETAVVRRRDPVLVNTSGPGRVFVQCFPVIRTGLQFKVEVTAPLQMMEPGRAELQLPYLEEINFSHITNTKLTVDGVLPKEVTITGDVPFDNFSEAQQRIWVGTEAQNGVFLKPGDPVEGFAPVVAVPLPEGAGEAWARNPFEEQGNNKNDGGVAPVVVQRLEQQVPAGLKRAVIVVDGSHAAAPHFRAIAQGLHRLPAGLEWRLILADPKRGPTDLTGETAAETVHNLERYSPPRMGGNPVPALAAGIQALEALGGIGEDGGEGVILWVSAPQPYGFESSALHELRDQPIDGRPAIRLQALSPGPMRAADLVRQTHDIKMARVTGDPQADLADFFANPADRQPLFKPRWSRAEEPPANLPHVAGPNLAQLWGADEVNRLLATDIPEDLGSALKIGMSHRIVTPVTGAVVLERQEQYDRHGLKPVAPLDMASVPEPEVWALLIASIPALGFAVWWRRRRQFGSAGASNFAAA